jgi:TonB family protein
MKMMATIRKNLITPPRVCFEGAVFVSFVVKADGTIADTKVVKGISPEVDWEAMRVVGLLTEWRPGEQNGEKVDMRMVIPVKFSSVIEE